MKILLDHRVPRRVAQHLTGHEVSTARQIGWDQDRNGRPMQKAADADFNALLTVDANLVYPRPPGRLPVAVVVISTLSDDIGDILKTLPDALAAMAMLEPGCLVEVGHRSRKKTRDR